jgi:hypothetical protein
VFFLTGTLTTASGNTSYINVRFVKDGVNVPRLNDVGVNQYPGTEGTTAFACFHSTGSGTATAGKVVLTAKKTGWNPLNLFAAPLASATYEGDIPGQIYALATPMKDAASSFEVTAEIYQDGKLLDKVTVPYDCQALGGECEDQTILYGIGGGVLLILIVLAFFVMRRKKAAPAITQPTV